MIFIKALLTGFVCVSLCLANISGLVTDTGTTPISGAVVLLELGGQKDTTEADGSFTLDIGTPGIFSGTGKLIQNGLFARISGNLMTVTLAERAAVEVATFNLSGKALSTVRKTYDAGSHFITLRQRDVGLHLYKVKSGNSELVLKGNSVNRAASGSSVYFPGLSSNRLAKQAMSTAAINDVIAATKTGYLNYRVVAYNSDTFGVQVKMIACAGTVTDVDGNVYQSVRIGNQVWMAENLRVTKYNDGTAILLDTSKASWPNAITPKYCFYNNTTNSDSIKKYGALYNWYVVSPTNTNKIAPSGWHIPADAEWDTLQNYLIAKGYNWDGTTTDNKIAKSLAAKTYWYTYSTAGAIGCDLTKNNSCGFSALPGGYRDISGFRYQSYYGYWWSATEDYPTDAWNRYLFYNVDTLFRLNYYKGCGFSVRLLRDN